MRVNIDGVSVPGNGWCSRAAGTAVTKIVAIAGKGTGVPFRRAAFYAAQYGGEFGDWQKMRGEMVVDCFGETARVEVHWAQCASVGIVGEKFKRRLD